jgi:hypothetical protein
MAGSTQGLHAPNLFGTDVSFLLFLFFFHVEDFEAKNKGGLYDMHTIQQECNVMEIELI